MNTTTRPLLQIDCWTDVEPGDCIVVSDDQGNALTGTWSDEAFTTPFTLRIFIEPGTDPAHAAQLLRKAAKWVERDPELLDRDGGFGRGF